jgi:glycosyltransferase involved in cell wall biosynthesis
MESLSRGRPVITTSIAGIPELVRDGKEGWVVPSGDAAALAAAMREALELSPKDLELMGTEGRARVFKQHSATKEAAHLAELAKAATAEQRS